VSDFLWGPGGPVFIGNGLAFPNASEPPPPDPDPDPGAVNPDNFLTLSDAAATTTANYPMRIGRPFIEGEIEDYPQARVNGVAVTTQAHVEQRWPDGSVKHAVMFFHVPSVPSGGSLSLTFQNQATGNTTGGLSAATVLASWDFDAVIEMVQGGVTRTASARAMLTAGHYWTCYSGSVATCFILCDHSASPAYDFGWDAYTPVRPVFHATFYPLTGQTCVRYIGEVGCKTQQLTNVVVASLTLKLGQASPTTVYTKATSTTMHALSRWTKVYWKGGTPPTINLNHNLAYLTSTTLVPNWNTDVVMTESAIASKYAGWTASSRNLYDAGFWALPMSNVGGRHEIGVAPGWVVWWLYTGDHRMAEMAFGQADIGGAFAIHYRESQYGRARPFQRLGSTDGGGKVMSPNVRPRIMLIGDTQFGAGSNTPAGDKVTLVGTVNVGNWKGDCAHYYDPHSLIYLMTGDYWHLEETWFWSSFAACFGNASEATYAARGPGGYTGGLEYGTEARTTAWPLLRRVHAATFTPTRFAEEKQLFTTLTDDFIAVAEGARNVTSPRVGGELWNWGNARVINKWPSGVVDPNGTWGGGSTSAESYIDYAVTYRSHSPWMHNFMVTALGIAKELGFDTDALLAYAAEQVTGFTGLTRAASTGTVDGPYYLSAYRRPYIKLPAPGVHFSSMTEVLSAYLATFNVISEWNTGRTDTTHGRANIALSAAAMCYDQPGGPATWSWFASALYDEAGLARFAVDPKWALMPRNLP
jgi:hypothetical protein